MGIDTCGSVEITLSPVDFTCEDVGDVMVTQTVTDVWQFIHLYRNVTVEDNIAPECLTENITVQLGQEVVQSRMMPWMMVM
jgi:hypothetical protein